ncbi:hypothetical protein AB0B66_13735 [Catellatospora sp. NPDC049111]|uniref:hypothetical protein n=1 Tax=Catellatospora sp. NPDC049111 TaxID=3155271 RepID=UPI00340D939D
MTPLEWDSLPEFEQDLLVCATEAWGILPYATDQHRGIGDPRAEAAAAARMVLELVDRGWITVHRIVPDAAGVGAAYGPAITQQLDALLADPDTWDDPDGVSWNGELAVALTPAGRSAIAR